MTSELRRKRSDAALETFPKERPLKYFDEGNFS